MTHSFCNLRDYICMMRNFYLCGEKILKMVKLFLHSMGVQNSKKEPYTSKEKRFQYAKDGTLGTKGHWTD